MSKKTNEQRLLAESLSNALEPQKKRGMPRAVLDQYDEGSEPQGIPAGILSAIPTGIPDSIPEGIPASIPEPKPARREKAEPFTYLDATHTASEKAVYSVMYRETISKGTDERNFGPAELLHKTGIRSRNTVHKAIYGLLEKLSIEVVEEARGNPLGRRYRVFKWQEIEERRKAAGIRIDPQSKRTVGIPMGIPRGIPATIPTAIPSNWDGGIASAGIPSIPKAGIDLNKEEVLKHRSWNDDDEVAAPLLRALKGAVGRKVEPAPLAELFELLAAEFMIAEGRTGMVSNPAAFFLEHMRRRLWKKDKRQLDREEKAEASAPAGKVDASKCPDCFGTGMYYPEGFEKGVTRCTHEQLAAAAPGPAPAAAPPTDEELVEMAVGFLHQGMDIEAAGQLLSASIDDERWPGIRAAVLERYERERGH